MRRQRLSPEQAYAAMALFLERYYARSGESDELASLLGALQISESDGLPLDPAAWADWLSAVEDALAERAPNDQLLGAR
jgi:hypothetical protein